MFSLMRSPKTFSGLRGQESSYIFKMICSPGQDKKTKYFPTTKGERAKSGGNNSFTTSYKPNDQYAEIWQDL